MRIVLDESDNRYLECAPAGRTQYILTGDRNLLDLGEYKGIAILMPAARIYGEIMGREVPAVSVNPGEPIPGLSEDVVNGVASFDMYDSPMEMDELCETGGVTLTPLETVARQMVSAMASA